MKHPKRPANTPASADPPANESLQHGILLGQRRAFGVVAGRCTAAHAESLRRIREGKLYSEHAPNWADYCTRFLKMNRRTADRMIGNLKEFGPAFFEVAQLTGITPEEYRAIAPAITKDGIRLDGQVIALLPENAERAVEAIAKLQKAAAPAPAKWEPASAKIAALDKRGREVADAMDALAKTGLGDADIERIVTSMDAIGAKLIDVRYFLTKRVC